MRERRTKQKTVVLVNRYTCVINQLKSSDRLYEAGTYRCDYNRKQER